MYKHNPISFSIGHSLTPMNTLFDDGSVLNLQKTKLPNIYTLKDPNLYNSKQWVLMNGRIVSKVPENVYKQNLGESDRANLIKSLDEGNEENLTPEMQASIVNQREISDFVNRRDRFGEDSKYTKLRERIQSGETLTPTEQKEYDKFLVLPKNQSLLDNLRQMNVTPVEIKELVDKLRTGDPGRLLDETVRLADTVELLGDDINEIKVGIATKAAETGVLTTGDGADIEFARVLTEDIATSSEIFGRVQEFRNEIETLKGEEKVVYYNANVGALNYRIQELYDKINDFNAEIVGNPILKGLCERTKENILAEMRNAFVLTQEAEKISELIDEPEPIATVHPVIHTIGLKLSTEYNDFIPVMSETFFGAEIAPLVDDTTINWDEISVKFNTLEVTDEVEENIDHFLNGYKYLIRGNYAYPIATITPTAFSYYKVHGKSELVSRPIANIIDDYRLAKPEEVIDRVVEDGILLSNVQFDNRYKFVKDEIKKNYTKGVNYQNSVSAFKILKLNFEKDL